MQSSVHTAATANIEATREQLRYDARGLGVLESIQTVIGIGVLVVIAVHAILASQDGGVQTAISCALILALAYLAMAFRMRSGAEIARRELWLMEAGHPSAPSRIAPDASAHPYRPMPREAALPTRSRGLRIESHAAIAALATGATLACVAISGS